MIYAVLDGEKTKPIQSQTKPIFLNRGLRTESEKIKSFWAGIN